jgi:hypothetical protein
MFVIERALGSALRFWASATGYFWAHFGRETPTEDIFFCDWKDTREVVYREELC